MGRLVIAHHKSYHPYKRDNIERVKRDEELAELEEQRAEGRIQLADAEARIHLLRERAGVDKDTKRKKRQTVEDEFADAERAAAAPAAQASGLPLSGGHINFFEDLEHTSIASAIQSSHAAKKAPLPAEDEKGVRLAPSEKDRNPWYSSSEKAAEPKMDDRRRKREDARKNTHDPLTFINSSLSSRPSSSSASGSSSRTSYPSSSSRNNHSAPSSTSNPLDARLSREQAERARVQELLRRKKLEARGSATPSTVRGGGAYSDLFNPDEVQAAHLSKRIGGERDRDEGGGWDRRTRDRRW